METLPLEEQIEHETQMLRSWTKAQFGEEGGDDSLMPKGWNIEKQQAFIDGMVHALSIIKSNK
jgi:hypothetical protein